MDKKYLDSIESKTIKAFIESYSDLFKRITELEMKLNSLDKTREDLKSKIEEINEEVSDIRVKEMKFTKSLKEKYGDFKLDMETFEIQKIEENESARNN
jgi:regulator of replication initiation timing